jgi:hypothetical protein
MQPDIIAHLVGPLAALLVVATSIVLVLRGPLGRALARRIEGSRATDTESVRRLDEVEARLQTVELTQERMLELEERLDFAERLLARRDVPEALPDRRV